MNARFSSQRFSSRLRVPLLLIWLASLSSATASVEVGDIPPDYLGKSVGGKEILLSESAGRIRIISFWATWCAPCLKELPVLNAIQTTGGAERIKVIAINLEEPRKQFRNAMRAYKDFEIEFVHDRRGTVAKKFDVKGIPRMLIIDVDGRVAYQHEGYTESALEGIVAEINALLVQNEMVEEQ